MLDFSQVADDTALGLRTIKAAKKQERSISDESISPFCGSSVCGHTELVGERIPAVFHLKQ